MVSIGSAAIVLQDNTSGDSRFGKFTVSLVSGFPPGGIGSGAASLAQVGAVPANAKTLLFETETFGTKVGKYTLAYLGGKSLSPVFVAPGLVGVDVSAFAGQTAELRFTAPFVPDTIFGGQTFFPLDNIRFSSVALVPEPSTWAVVGCGGLALWAMRGLRRS